MADRRRTFAPVVLLGLAAATLTAVAANQPWVSVEGSDESSVASAVTGLSTEAKLPLALALGLVVLAAWGVLLVTRGPVRRVVAWGGLLAALGVVVTVVAGYRNLPDDLREDLTRGGGVADVTLHYTAWFWVAAVASVLSVLALTLAVRFVRDWPEMGTRYDAPGSAPGSAPSRPPESSEDYWKAIDEGRDPTEGPA